MQIIKTTEPERTNIKHWFDCFIEHRYYLIMFTCLCIGMLFGAITVKHLAGANAVFADEWFSSFLEFRSSASFWQIFFKCFFTGISYLVIVCVLAFGVGGIAVCPVLIFLRGFGTCMLSGMMYRDFSLQGIVYADLILLPSCLVIDFVLIYFSSKALDLSVNCVSVFKGNVQLVPQLRTISIELLRKMLRCVIAVILSSVAEAVFTVCFTKYFNLG